MIITLPKAKIAFLLKWKTFILVISSLASKSALSVVSLGVVIASGIGIWKLNSQQKSSEENGLDLKNAITEKPNKNYPSTKRGELVFPSGYRWLEIEGNRDDANWKRRAAGTSSLSGSEEEKIKELKKVCSEIKNKKSEEEISFSDKNRALGWCGWNDLESSGIVLSKL